MCCPCFCLWWVSLYLLKRDWVKLSCTWKNSLNFSLVYRIIQQLFLWFTIPLIILKVYWMWTSSWFCSWLFHVSMSWSFDPFATKLHHHEPECCVTILDCCAQGHSEGSGPQGIYILYPILYTEFHKNAKRSLHIVLLFISRKFQQLFFKTRWNSLKMWNYTELHGLTVTIWLPANLSFEHDRMRSIPA